MAVIKDGLGSVGLWAIDAATDAGRVQTRPRDVGTLGSYMLDAMSGTMAAGLAGASPVFSCRWSDATRAMVLERFSMYARTFATAFSAGATLFELYVARSFTVVDTGGGAVSFAAGGGGKRRTSFGTTLITAGDMRISTTATLTAGTRTKDTNPVGRIRGFVPATVVNYPFVGKNLAIIAGASTFAWCADNIDLFNPDEAGSRWPQVFVQNEGFVLEATVPATGTWEFGVHMEWSEIATTGGFN